MHRKTSNPGSFTTLIGNYPHGTDPGSSRALDHPSLIRVSHTYEPVMTDKNASAENGRMALSAGSISPASGEFTVIDNDFSTGRAVIYLGNYELISYIDFVPGININATAAAVSDAIDALPGFSSSVLGAVVNVNYEDGPADEIEFRIAHFGEKTNFTSVTPGNGFLGVGDPHTTAPLLG